MKKLDKKKPYGAVCGAGRARFEQSGSLFDAHGNELLTDEPLAVGTKQTEPEGGGKEKKSAKKEVEPTTATDSVIDEQLAAQGSFV